jgi:hypothetical protein
MDHNFHVGTNETRITSIVVIQSRGGEGGRFMFPCLLPMKVVESVHHLKSNYALRIFVVAAKVSRQEVGLCVN